MFPTNEATTARRTIDSPPHSFATIAFSIALTALLVATVGLFASQATTSPSPAETVVADEVVDGWSSYLGGAAPKPEAEVVDGWSSYLTPKAPEVVDGWSSYLLVPEAETQPVIDGWMSRYGGRDD